MFFVYILKSEGKAERFYTGVTEDLDSRLLEHNSGEVAHTAKFKPWRLKNYIAFNNKTKAFAFESYLKSGSGRSFAKRHF